MRAAKKPPPHAFVVDLPKTEAGAYNPDRPISGLLENQVRRLHEPERRLPRRHHTGVDVGKIKTEGEAAAYIARVTAAIHAHARAMAKKPTKHRAGKKRASRRVKPARRIAARRRR